MVTLNEINITPLLDIAFVLLIIFIITTPLLEQGLPLELPVGETEDTELDPKDIQVVELHPEGVAEGFYRLNSKYMPLEEMTERLIGMHRENPDLIVFVRAAGDSPYKYVAQVLDRLKQGGISQFSLRTEPTTVEAP